jgi:hypothetical protein
MTNTCVCSSSRVGECNHDVNEILNRATAVVNRRTLKPFAIASCATPSMPSKGPSQRLRDIVDNIDANRVGTVIRGSIS